MMIKNKDGSKLNIYQAKSGAIGLVWGNKHKILDRNEIDFFGIESSLYDLEDFSIVEYKKFYDLV